VPSVTNLLQLRVTLRQEGHRHIFIAHPKKSANTKNDRYAWSSEKADFPNYVSGAREHGVDLDTPFKTLGKRIRCQRCGTRGGERGVSAYGQPYSNFEPQPRASACGTIRFARAAAQTTCRNGGC
jgi:hypothetical protein